MHFFIYFTVCLFLITIQTTLLPAFPRLFAQFDLLIPFLAFLVLFRSPIGRLPALILAGSLMDLLSGGRAGIYLLTYVGILAGIRKATAYCHLEDKALFQITVMAAVTAENLLFGLMIGFGTWSFQPSLHALKIFGTQLLWALVSAPIFFHAWSSLFGGIDQIIAGGLKERL
jgi:cell shape-determining protein MreD